MRTLLAALLLAGALGPATGQAQQPGMQVQVLHDSHMPATLCDATTAIRVIAAPLEPDSRESLLNPDLRIDIERMVLRSDGTIERRAASIRPGTVECSGGYIADYVPLLSGHVFSRFLRWPRDAETPIELGEAADLGMSGPGIVFSAHYPSETVQQSRARLPGSLFLLLPEGVWDMPTSSVRVGTSPAGAPLLLVVQKADTPRNIAIAVVETGRDPVALHRAELRIDGVAEKPEAAVLSTWRSRPALRFAYRAPDDDNFLVIGAATCNPPQALSDDVVTCHPLVRTRVPSDSRDPSQWAWGADRALIAIAENGTRAFVLTTDSRRWCLRTVTPASGAVAEPSACVLEMLGAATGLGAVSDHEALLLVTDGEKQPTYRLLRVRGL